MFETDQGLGPGKWLKWFVGLMAVYAITTFWPENRLAIWIGGILSLAAIQLAVYQIRKARREK